MSAPDTVILSRDVEAALVPAGTEVVLQKGQTAQITQSLGGSFTVVVNGNMFRIEENNADALGLEIAPKPAPSGGGNRTQEDVEREVWEQLKTCYDPEIPVNIVDLGLVYSCQVVPAEQPDSYRVEMTMTLTAPGCGMGPTIVQDVEKKLTSIGGIVEAKVELAWEPTWNQSMLAEADKLKRGMY